VSMLRSSWWDQEFGTTMTSCERMHSSEWPGWLISVALAVAICVGNTGTSHSQSADRPISFVNDVSPILTKAGCNVGVCHAKAGGGQNGFQLSLLGFEPLEDFEHLTQDDRGRRLFLTAPEQSLLL